LTKIFLTLSIIFNLLLGIFLVKTKVPSPTLYSVQRIIDGDTFVVDEPSMSAGRQIRLMSVNAPEVGLCGADEATALLTKLLAGKKVRLAGELNDHFGRFLALVYVDDQLVNEEMILSGWARFTSTASIESEKLKAAFQSAKSANLGVFSPKCYQSKNPLNSKCDIKGNVREGSKTYFFPGCGNYSNVALELDQGDQWFCSEKEAVKAGFTRAANCHADY
jgi:micrococcal nuclease